MSRGWRRCVHMLGISHSMTWPSFQACSATANVCQSVSFLVFFDSLVFSSSSFSNVVVTTLLYTTLLQSLSSVGSFTLLRRQPSKRQDLKAVLIVWSLHSIGVQYDGCSDRLVFIIILFFLSIIFSAWVARSYKVRQVSMAQCYKKAKEEPGEQKSCVHAPAQPPTIPSPSHRRQTPNIQARHTPLQCHTPWTSTSDYLSACLPWQHGDQT